jgi:hypothetical protein
MALGSRNEQHNHHIKMPPDDLRYQTLSDHPVGAAVRTVEKNRRSESFK